ncbi:MAG: SRPBCC family protein [Phycisphaerales bacterium]|jgi:ligand-binding SRPBCC domain-containing protein
MSTQEHVLGISLWLPVKRAALFPFFADAANLNLITPPWVHFKILTPLPLEMREGALLDYRIRLHGIPIRWRTRITSWEPDRRFVDEQIKGPYYLWRHEHTFEDADGGTLCRDRVTYAHPGGALVHRWFVGPDVKRIFEYRQARLLAMFGAGRQAMGDAPPVPGAASPRVGSLAGA